MRASKQRWAPSAMVRPALWFCACNLLAAAMSAQCTNPTQVPNGTYTTGDHSQVDNNALSASSFGVSTAATATFAAGNCIHLGTGFRANAVGATVPTTFHAWVDIAPTPISVVPSSPPQNPPLTQSFTWTVSSPAGRSNLSHVFALFNSTSLTANACYIHYDASSNLVYLADNASGTWLGGFAPSGTGSIGNSQCTIAGTNSSPNPTSSGTQLGLALNVTFNATTFSGNKNEYMYALDGSGVSTGWQQMGTWTVPAPPAPDFTLTAVNDSYYVQTQVMSYPTYALAITPQNGFNSPVSFSISWPMYGCGYPSYNPSVVTGSPWTTTVSMQCYETLQNGYWTQVTASGGGKSHSVNLFLYVAASPLSIMTATLPNGALGTYYSVSLVASGGGSTYYSWSLYSGSLPPGLSLSSGGIISGTPTAAGTANFTVRVTDGLSASATRALALTVSGAALTITTSALSNATVGVPYSASLAASGGTPPYSWSLSSGNLPAGLSLSSSGTISGTPTTAGAVTFTVRVTDTASASTTRGLTLTVSAAALTITTSSLSNATLGAPYSTSLAATGGTPPYTWSLYSGSLPSGLALSSNGTISGTPTAIGTSSFTVQVTDSASAANTKGLTLTVSSSTLSITTTSLSNATVSTSYSASLTANGGTAPYSWSLDSGALPSGLSLSSGGTISGTPTATGTSNFTVRVTDSLSATNTQPLTLTVSGSSLSITTTSLSSANVCTSYSASLNAAGGSPPYTWALINGTTLPPGLTLSGNTIGGKPTATGTYGFTIRVTDSISGTANAGLNITVNAALAVPSREYIRLGGRVVALADCGGQ